MISCRKCGRDIHPGRDSCLYCGWSETPQFDESKEAPSAAPVVPKEPRLFRPGATTASFALWSIIAAVGAVLLARHARGVQPGGAEFKVSILSAAALTIAGPLALAAQIARMALVTITVDPEQGLRLSAGRRIAWAEIEGIEYRGARFISDFAVVRLLLHLIRSTSDLVLSTHGPIRLVLLLLMILISLLIPMAAIISGVFFPVFFLLSPWQPRIVMTLKSGERLTWRDLRHEADFVSLVERGIQKDDLERSRAGG